MHSLRLTEQFQELIVRMQSPELAALMQRLCSALPAKPTYQDYEQGINSLYAHISERLPEILRGGKQIIDVGPGIGSFMVIARACGNTVMGEDLSPIGSPTVAAYKEITSWWELTVHYNGFHRYLATGSTFPYEPGSIDLWHFRGSLDGVLCSYPGGIEEAADRLFAQLYPSTAPDGKIWIGHNQELHTHAIVQAIQARHGEFKIVQDSPCITELTK